MKRVVLLIVITVTLMWMPYKVVAGEYHNPNPTANNLDGTLACSDCHSIHGTQGGTSMLFDNSTVNIRLLRADTPLQLCRYCHEDNALSMTGPAPPDIWNNTQGYTPSAGDFADNNIADDTNRHDMGRTNMTATPPPGYQGTWSNVTDKYSTTFNCLYCHNQHGNKNYRNLRYDPGNPANDKSTSSVAVKVTYSLDGGSCSDGVGSYPNCDIDNITGTGSPPAEPNLYKYNRGNVRFRRTASGTEEVPNPSPTPINAIAPWCGKCHVDFHGAGGDPGVSPPKMGGSPAGDNAIGNEWIRHPVRDVSIGEASTNLHADLTNWSTALTNRTRHIEPDATPLIDGDEEPFCFSCHYVHGGGNPGGIDGICSGPSDDDCYNHSNLVKFDDSGDLNLQGSNPASSYLIRNTCQQCHNQ